MRSLPAAELLEAWERGWSESPPARALTLLERSCPDLDSSALYRLSVGQRDALLLAMREATFGPNVTALAACPECSEELEFSFCIEDIRIPDVSVAPAVPISLELEGVQLQFRLPNLRDLLSIETAKDAEAARSQLIERCLLSAHWHGDPLPAIRVPMELLAKMEDEMSRLDAQANVEIVLDCSSCHASWGASFDIAAFFWSELNAWARRLLVEVHTLASRYGWREAEILSMSATRRNLYLNMIGQ
jgi:hypothetical protein